MADVSDTPGPITRLILRYVRAQLGEGAVPRVRELAGDPRTIEELEDPRTWSTREQRHALFSAVARLTGDERVAFHIGANAFASVLGWPRRPLLRAFGSPRRVVAHLVKRPVQLSEAAPLRLVRSSSERAVVATRLGPMHQASAHDCWYHRGLLSQVPVLFGWAPTQPSHPTCELQGAEDCVFAFDWPRWRWWSRSPRRRGTEHRLPAAAGQLSAFGHAVSHLIATDDLGVILQRVGGQAAATIHAPSHLLVARTREGVQLHADGIPTERADELAEALLATGADAIQGVDALSAPIRTPRRHHGWLVAFQREGTAFLPGDAGHLEVHAGLAAGALEVVDALQTARLIGDRNAALVNLGRQLAHERTEEAIASRVAEAMPRVVGAERASVLLWDEEQQHMQTVAAVGFGELTDQALDFAIPLGATPALRNLVADPRPRRFDRETSDPFVRASLDAFGHTVATVAAIVADEEMIGLVLTISQHDDPSWDDPGQEMEAVASVADQAAIAISRLRLLANALHAATHDHLTGLADRALFEDRIERALTDNRRSGACAAVCFLDLDGFKAVNDTYGHAAGDALLVEVASRLRETVRETDTVARLAGDEFALLLRDLNDAAVASRVAEDVGRAIRAPYTVSGATVVIDVSIGIAMAPHDGETSVELLRRADTAMYAAKQAGGTYRYAEWDAETSAAPR